MSRVEYLAHMGNDQFIVDAARVSFAADGDRDRTEMQDTALIEYLATGLRTKERNALIAEIMQCNDSQDAEELIRRIQNIVKHWSPFSHAIASFKITAPIFVARQLLRSTVGFAVNEVSRRYFKGEPDFARLTWRVASPDVKQGSGGELEDTGWADVLTDLAETAALEAYTCQMAGGIAPEQARANLPQTMHTRWIWTGSIYAFARVCVQRLDPHAQKESREVAEMISAYLLPLFPLSWKALVR